MGYTIYWYREKSVDQANFSSVLKDFKTIQKELDRNGVLLAGPDGSGLPMINDYGVSFNGPCESQGCCEAFTFVQELIFVHREPRKKDGRYLQYVKTEGLPYSLAVAAFLIIAKHHFRNQIIISSDKPYSMWEKPREWCQIAVSYGADFLPENDYF